MAEYVLAIDQGTTSSRALLFDKLGVPVAKHQLDFTQHYPKPGWAEHDPKEILDTVLQCCAEAVEQAGVTVDQVGGIGITNQRETTVAWDSETGEPLYNAIVWLDLRTSSTSSQLCKAPGGMDRFRAKTGLPVSTYFASVKMKWMIDNVPEVTEAVADGRARFGTIESWLIYKMTGGKDGGVHITDLSNASRYMLMDLSTHAWDPEICNALGVPITCLPEIRSNCETYGHVKGYGSLDGLPICAALGDQHAALLGQGCLEVGSSKNTYGTGCFMLVNTGHEAIPSTSGLLTTIGYKLGPNEKTTYALEGSVACAGRTIQWLRDSVGIIGDAAETEALAMAVQDTGGVTLVPAFSGLFAPHWRQDSRAVLCGMTLYTKKEHIVRAALEAVAFSTVDVMHAVRRVRLGEMRVDGGMTANTFLMQKQADLLGVDVLRAKMPEATVLGAALAAGIACGLYQSASDVKEMLENAGGHERFSPTMKADVRSREYARWADAIKRSHELDRWSPEAETCKGPTWRTASYVVPAMENLDMKVKVLRLADNVGDDGYRMVYCGDQTGLITLRFMHLQNLPSSGQSISITNARTVVRDGYLYVAAEKWEPNDDDHDCLGEGDFSSIRYEVQWRRAD